MKNEIKKGWNIVLSVEIIEYVPNLILNPIGVATHIGVTEDDSFVEKIGLGMTYRFQAP